MEPAAALANLNTPPSSNNIFADQSFLFVNLTSLITAAHFSPSVNAGLVSCPNAPHAVFWPSCISLLEACAMSLFVLIVMMVIVLGNLMVVLTVANDNKLRAQRQNWLLVSLAMADLLVGLLVMPLTLIYEIVGIWVLGSVLCELWLALDVLFVTASILHICIISLDRYWSVTLPLSYPAKRTPKRITIMIGVAWLVSFLICFPPLLGWRPKRRPGECSVSSKLDYVLYSSLGSFYIPVAILVVVYMRIYMITKRHSQQRLKDTQRMGQTLSQLSSNTRGATYRAYDVAPMAERKKQIKFSKSTPDDLSSADPSTSMKPTPSTSGKEHQEGGGTPPTMTTVPAARNCCFVVHQQPPRNKEETQQQQRQKVMMMLDGSDSLESALTTTMFDDEQQLPIENGTKKGPTPTPTEQSEMESKKHNCGTIANKLLTQLFRKGCNDEKVAEIVRNRSLEKRKRRLKAKERQATLLLGLILFAFIFSWMPFFIMYVLNALDIHAPAVVFKFFFWLGYCNSAINPIIYTYYNREFRRALLRLLRRHQHRLHCLQRFSYY